MKDVGIIKDADNLILLDRAHPYFSSSMTYFKGPFILVDLIKRLIMSINVDMGSSIIYHMATIGSEGVTGTSAPALASTVPPRLIVVEFMNVPKDFL